MASRGRRGGVPAREDEPRREERAEQQAPTPQGPVIPPPPPVDYGVFMQGLVQAMQTQAHTQAALQAQLEAQERADVWWASLLCTRFEDGAVDVAWDEQEGEMEQYLEEKKASQKRPATTFQRQDKKKAVFQTQQRSVAVSSTQDEVLEVDKYHWLGWRLVLSVCAVQESSLYCLGLVGDTPLEEIVESDSELGE
ncbi:hypothetical protein Taro_033577 [Colocasia esculenta]|uniref:Uncharacterized protein n=1 Tax=Colocasia esculenta TaxID=4460 RepID=A0A843VP43_COLES|nr:hypothetical protein [Colocasia esculenta]